MRKLTGAEVVLNKTVLSYLRPGEVWIYRVIAPYGGQLCRLDQACQSLSSGSGFSEVSLLWLILSRIRPVIPRATFSQQLRSRGPEAVTVIINSAGLNWRDAWRVFQAFQRNPLKKRRLPSPQHARILQLAAARGGMPSGHGQKIPFWESIRLELEKEFGTNAPTWWQAIRKAYSTIRSCLHLPDRDNHDLFDVSHKRGGSHQNISNDLSFHPQPSGLVTLVRIDHIFPQIVTN